MNKVTLDILAQRLAILIATLKPFEQIEIKLADDGQVSVLVTTKHKELFAVE